MNNSTESKKSIIDRFGDEITPDGRFKLKSLPTGSSDHFMHPEREWGLIDLKNNKQLFHISGDTHDVNTPQSVHFSKDCTQIVAINGNGNKIFIDINTLLEK